MTMIIRESDSNIELLSVFESDDVFEPICINTDLKRGQITFLFDDNHKYFVGIVNNEVVGYISLVNEDNKWWGHTAVKKIFRHLSGVLMDSVKDYVKLRYPEIKTIYGNVPTHNLRSEAYHIKHGFTLLSFSPINGFLLHMEL